MSQEKRFFKEWGQGVRFSCLSILREIPRAEGRRNKSSFNLQIELHHLRIKYGRIEQEVEILDAFRHHINGRLQRAELEFIAIHHQYTLLHVGKAVVSFQNLQN